MSIFDLHRRTIVELSIHRISTLPYRSAKMDIEIGERPQNIEEGNMKMSATEIEVPVWNIKYDLDGMLGFESYVEYGLTKEGVLNDLPSTGTVLWSEDDISLIGRIQKDIESDTGWLVIGFDYEFEGKTNRYDELPINQTVRPTFLEEFRNHMKEVVA